MLKYTQKSSNIEAKAQSKLYNHVNLTIKLLRLAKLISSLFLTLSKS